MLALRINSEAGKYSGRELMQGTTSTGFAEGKPATETSIVSATCVIANREDVTWRRDVVTRPCVYGLRVNEHLGCKS